MVEIPISKAYIFLFLVSWRIKRYIGHEPLTVVMVLLKQEVAKYLENGKDPHP